MTLPSSDRDRRRRTVAEHRRSFRDHMDESLKKAGAINVNLSKNVNVDMDVDRRWAMGGHSKSSGTKKWSGRLVRSDKSWFKSSTSSADSTFSRVSSHSCIVIFIRLRFSSLYIFLRLYNRCTLRRLICGVGFSEELVKVQSCAVLPLFW